MSGNHIFYGCDDGYIYELSRKNGKVERRFFVGTAVSPNPFIWNGRLYTGEGIHVTHHARVYAYDLASGRHLAAYPTLGHTEGQPIIASHQGRDLMFIVSGGDGVHAVDPLTFTPVWHHLDGHVDGSVRVKNGRVFAGSAVLRNEKHAEPVVAAYVFSDGSLLWKNVIPVSSWFAPVVTENEVYFALGEINRKNDFGQLACYDQATGKRLWKVNTTAPLNSAPIRVGNRIYVSDQQERVNMFNLKTRALVWSRQTVEKAQETLSAGVSYDCFRHVVLYPSSSDGLYVLDPDTGQVLWRWMPENEDYPWHGTYARVVVTEEFWYLNDGMGTVRSLRPLAPGATPY